MFIIKNLHDSTYLLRAGTCSWWFWTADVEKAAKFTAGSFVLEAARRHPQRFQVLKYYNEQ